MNNKGKFLIIKRSENKDIFPGNWELGIAETVRSGESYEEAASRGLKEELGIDVPPTELVNSFQFALRYRSPNYKTNDKVYSIMHNGKLTPQKEEVDKIQFLTKDETKNLIASGNFHPAASMSFEKCLKRAELKHAQNAGFELNK